MRIAVTGGTGTLGRHVATELRSRGQDVRVLSRNAEKYRVDLTTGEGLGEALRGSEVVIDAANASKRAAGPEIVEIRELARTWRSVTGRGALLFPLPLPGRIGRALRDGVLAAQRPEVRGTTPFASWLEVEGR